MRYICDNKRHLICVPYSIENLHKMAEELDIKRCWFHKNHYDIPAKRIKEIQDQCTVVSPKIIIQIIRSPKHAETFLSEEIKQGGAAPQDFFLITQIQYHGREDA